MKIEGWRARVSYKRTVDGFVSCRITMFAPLAGEKPLRLQRVRFGATGRTASEAFDAACAIALSEVLPRKCPAWKKHAQRHE